jgi:hypothetical protein
MKKVEKTTTYRSSDIAGCDSCDWNGTGGWEARKHTLETGHTTWNEWNMVSYYRKV